MPQPDFLAVLSGTTWSGTTHHTSSDVRGDDGVVVHRYLSFSVTEQYNKQERECVLEDTERISANPRHHYVTERERKGVTSLLKLCMGYLILTFQKKCP